MTRTKETPGEHMERIHRRLDRLRDRLEKAKTERGAGGDPFAVRVLRSVVRDIRNFIPEDEDRRVAPDVFRETKRRIERCVETLDETIDDLERGDVEGLAKSLDSVESALAYVEESLLLIAPWDTRIGKKKNKEQKEVIEYEEEYNEKKDKYKKKR